MALGKKKEDIESIEPVEENITLADIVETEEDKKILEPAPAPAPIKKGFVPFKTGKVNIDVAYARQQPEKYSEIVCLLRKDDVVVIDDAGSVDEWYKVTSNGVVGFILKKVITVD